MEQRKKKCNLWGGEIKTTFVSRIYRLLIRYRLWALLSTTLIRSMTNTELRDILKNQINSRSKMRSLTSQMQIIIIKKNFSLYAPVFSQSRSTCSSYNVS